MGLHSRANGKGALVGQQRTFIRLVLCFWVPLELMWKALGDNQRGRSTLFIS